MSGYCGHKELIPWDDDIHIVMPNCDYIKFKRYVEEEWFSYPKISDGSDNKYYGLMFMKVHNIKKVNDKIIVNPFQ
ncbi:MAG: LicD family protein [Lacrimispora saccharolytica]